MIAAEHTVLILLAAGRSSRFVGGDKLEADFAGRPVGLHVVTALESVPFGARLVVKDRCDLTFDGYEVVRNPAADAGMSESIRLGVMRARDIGAAAVLIALADMPRVTAAHVFRLLDGADGEMAVVASSDGRHPCPPALFGAGHFDTLMRLDGDAGARALIRSGRHVVADPAELVDIDTVDDLARLRATVHAPDALIRGAARRSD
jgi:molybdenum cofactor cytidylyltransferase